MHRPSAGRRSRRCNAASVHTGAGSAKPRRASLQTKARGQLGGRGARPAGGLWVNRHPGTGHQLSSDRPSSTAEAWRGLPCDRSLQGLHCGRCRAPGRAPLGLEGAPQLLSPAGPQLHDTRIPKEGESKHQEDPQLWEKAVAPRFLQFINQWHPKVRGPRSPSLPIPRRRRRGRARRQ